MPEAIVAAPAAPASAPAAPAAGAPAAPAAGAPAPDAAAAPAAPLSIGEGGDPAAAAAAEPAAKADAGTAVTYEKTGDVGLDMALDFVGKLGFGPEDAAMVAAGKGDFSLLRAKLGALGDKAAGYENFLALAEKSHADGAAKAAAKVKADTEAIHSAVGGPENWAAISKWAGENADPAERASINAVLKEGGFAAKLVAQGLAERYNRASGTVVEPANAIAKDAAGKPDQPEPLSARGFADESAKLRVKHGADFERTPAYKALVIRRDAGRRLGK